MKTFIVTGATQGLGLATAQALAQTPVTAWCSQCATKPEDKRWPRRWVTTSRCFASSGTGFNAAARQVRGARGVERAADYRQLRVVAGLMLKLHSCKGNFEAGVERQNDAN